MKKFLIILILAILCLSLIACGNTCDHNDADGDGKCDACGESMTTPPSECTEHKDENGDGKCDNCGTTVSTATEGTVELVKDGSAQFQVVMDLRTPRA